MRPSLAIAAALLLNGWLVAPEGLAQQGSSAARGGRTSRGVGFSEAEELRSYRTRDERAFAAERQDNARPYVKMPPPSPAETRARAAVFAQARTYYPTMRKGQSPNKNVVDPRTLCVPGRRALIQR